MFTLTHFGSILYYADTFLHTFFIDEQTENYTPDRHLPSALLSTTTHHFTSPHATYLHPGRPFHTTPNTSVPLWYFIFERVGDDVLYCLHFAMGSTGVGVVWFSATRGASLTTPLIISLLH